MPPWIAWLIAAVSTAAFVSLWFWEVRRVLNDRKSIVDSAAGQLTSFRRRAVGGALRQGIYAGAAPQ